MTANEGFADGVKGSTGQGAAGVTEVGGCGVAKWRCPDTLARINWGLCICARGPSDGAFVQCKVKTDNALLFRPTMLRVTRDTCENTAANPAVAMATAAVNIALASHSPNSTTICAFNTNTWIKQDISNGETIKDVDVRVQFSSRDRR